MAEPGPEAVVERAQTGDPDAFVELYRRFGRRVFGLARHMLGSVEAAEDARSEVFLRVRRTIGTYEPSIPFAGWLLSIASHYCVDVLRRRRVESRLFVPGDPEAVPTAEPGAPAPSPLGRLLVEERRDEVRDAMAGLPDQYRVPLALRYYAELSYDEIAAQLGLKRNHVATLLFRGKQELRRRLGDESFRR